MTPQDAAVVGMRLAMAALIVASGIAVGSACAGLVMVLKLFLR